MSVSVGSATWLPGSDVAGATDLLAHADRALYAAVAGSETPTLDAGLRRLSLAADQSKLWLGIAAGMALLGGSRSRRAAATDPVQVLRYE